LGPTGEEQVDSVVSRQNTRARGGAAGLPAGRGGTPKADVDGAVDTGIRDASGRLDDSYKRII
jgi:hypothetical protein